MTRATLLTPTGRGAVAVVSVRGPRAVEAVESCFLSANKRPLAEQPLGAIRFGHWLIASGEELLVTRIHDDEVEVHCHGGIAASGAILASLAKQGCEVASKNELEQSVGKTPLADAAWGALQEATTEAEAAILIDQASGALDAELLKVIESIKVNDLSRSQGLLLALLNQRKIGERLLNPWRVVLVGPPNVGKSSLINALLGYERALVYDQPGVTRDVVSAKTAIGGWPVLLSDTAGLRDSNDGLESQGVELTRRALRSADVVLLVQEARTAPNSDLVASLKMAEEAVLLSIASKVDLQPGYVETENQIATSVIGPPGVETLIGAIEGAIGVKKPEQGTGVPYRPWHFEWLELADDLLNSGDVLGAVAALEALLAGDQSVTIGQES